jgi:hypothetical protein
VGAIRRGIELHSRLIMARGGWRSRLREGGFGCKGLVLGWMGKFLGAVTGGVGRLEVAARLVTSVRRKHQRVLGAMAIYWSRT